MATLAFPSSRLSMPPESSPDLPTYNLPTVCPIAHRTNIVPATRPAATSLSSLRTTHHAFSARFTTITPLKMTPLSLSMMVAPMRPPDFPAPIVHLSSPSRPAALEYLSRPALPAMRPDLIPMSPAITVPSSLPPPVRKPEVFSARPDQAHLRAASVQLLPLDWVDWRFTRRQACSLPRTQIQHRTLQWAAST